MARDTVELRPVPASAVAGHRREWVARVTEIKATGTSLSEACRQANRELDCEHAPLSYGEWKGEGENVEHRTSNIEHRMDEAKTESPSAGSGPGGTHMETETMAKHTTGPNMDAEHWREFVGLVIGLVDADGSECFLAEALAHANETMGTGHSMGSYRNWSKKLGMRPKTTRGELVSRERRRRKEREAGGKAGGASGGTRHAVSVPTPTPGLPSPEPAEGAGNLVAAFPRLRQNPVRDADVLPPPGTDGPVDMISRTIDLLMGRAKPYLDAVATLQETRTALLEAGE